MFSKGYYLFKKDVKRIFEFLVKMCRSENIILKKFMYIEHWVKEGSSLPISGLIKVAISFWNT